MLAFVHPGSSQHLETTGIHCVSLCTVNVCMYYFIQAWEEGNMREERGEIIGRRREGCFSALCICLNACDAFLHKYFKANVCLFCTWQ